MSAIFLTWILSAVLILVICAVSGLSVTKRVSGLLIDGRGRYSLTHLQVALWTSVVLSLLLGRSIFQWIGPAHEIDLYIPSGLLAILAIVFGSAVISSYVKSVKDRIRADNVSASIPVGRRAPAEVDTEDLIPRFIQVFTREEGVLADRVLDVTKFQNLIITYIVAIVYLCSALVSPFGDRLAELPEPGQALIIVLSISHATHLLGKLPPQSGIPLLTVKERDGMLAAGRVPSRSRRH